MEFKDVPFINNTDQEIKLDLGPDNPSSIPANSREQITVVLDTPQDEVVEEDEVVIN